MNYRQWLSAQPDIFHLCLPAMIKLGQQLPGLIVQVVGGLAINSLACALTIGIVRVGRAYRAAHTGETVVAVVAEAQAPFTQYIAIRVLFPTVSHVDLSRF
ncbi:hypothetical protein MnBA_37670 [Marinobacterium sp. BA1]